MQKMPEEIANRLTDLARRKASEVGYVAPEMMVEWLTQHFEDFAMWGWSRAGDIQEEVEDE